MKKKTMTKRGLVFIAKSCDIERGVLDIKGTFPVPTLTGTPSNFPAINAHAVLDCETDGFYWTLEGAYAVVLVRGYVGGEQPAGESPESNSGQQSTSLKRWLRKSPNTCATRVRARAGLTGLACTDPRPHAGARPGRIPVLNPARAPKPLFQCARPTRSRRECVIKSEH